MRTRRADLSRIGAGRATLLLGVVVAFVALAAVAAYAVVTTLDTYEPDDTPATAKPLVLGAAKQMRTLHYTTGGDVDWVTFQAQQGKGYIIETGDLNPSTTDTVLELYAGDASTLLAQNDDFGFSFASRIAWKAPATGTYYVRVKGRHAGINGNYSLTLREAGAIAGTVTEHGTGMALSGITVDLWQWDQDGYYVFFETQTNTSGQYEFGAVPPGTWRVGFYDWAGAHEERFYNNKTGVESADDVSVTGGSVVTGIAAALPRVSNALTVIEVAGANRYETAIETSRRAYPEGLDPLGTRTLLIATGRNWPDALGGSALAGAVDGPILLVPPGSVPDAVTSEIERLGAQNALVLGGERAVSNDVLIALEALLEGSVQRIAGADRYGTAAAVAEHVISELESRSTYDGTALIATGGGFADALAAAPLASYAGWPLLLAHPTKGLDDITKLAMGSGVNRVLILGGTAAVSADTETYVMERFGSGGVQRIQGENRYATAAAVAAYGVEHSGLYWDRVGIATGENYPDALAGGVLQARERSVMLLTRTASLPDETRSALAYNKGKIWTVAHFGGTMAVSSSVRSAVEDALKR